MALIICKMIQCPYNDTKGFCAKPTVISIDEAGMCDVLWKKGKSRMLRMPFSNDNYPKEPVVIVDVAENELHDITKEENGEEVRPV